MSKDLRQHETDVAEAGCAQFEKTLGLLDGLLSGAERDAAEQHTGSCPVCAPLVATWAPVSAALRDHLEAAAELAKPELAGLADQVFEQIDGQKRVAKESRPGWFSRLIAAFRPSQPYYAFAAAAAVAAMVVVPIVYSGGSAPTTTVGAAHHCDLDNDVHQESGEVNDETGFHMHTLSFGSAKGSVLTATDGTPVIWVSEHDGA